jgi:hypothetical protein
MYPSSSIQLDKFEFSMCSAKQFRQRLFDENKKLKFEYTCLVKDVPRNFSNWSDLETFDRNINRKLPSNTFSMSDMCRLTLSKNDTFAVHMFSCYQIQCFFQEHYFTETLDGLTCRLNGHFVEEGVCLAGECVSRFKNIKADYLEFD